MKRLLCILLAAALLAGCGAGELRLWPQAEPTPAPSAPPAAEQAGPRRLAVSDGSGALAAVLEAYGAAQGVEVEYTDEAPALVVSAAAPEAGQALAAEEMDGLTRAALSAAGGGDALELPSGAYGYLARADLLEALLGAGAAEALAGASYSEWSAFLQALAGWLEQPAAADVTLAGQDYALPAEKPAALEGLAAAFTVAAQDQFSGPVLAPVLGTCYKTAEQAAAGGRTDAEQVGALNSLWTLLSEELQSLAGPEGALPAGSGAALTRAQAREAFARGTALFYRASDTELAAAGVENGVVLPLKFSFDNTDLHGGYALEELLGQPVAAGGGWLYISANADADARREAEAFLLWFYASEEGRRLAAGTQQAEGLPDVSAALAGETLEAVAAAGRQLTELTRFDTAGRRAYTDAVLASLP